MIQFKNESIVTIVLLTGGQNVKITNYIKHTYISHSDIELKKKFETFSFIHIGHKLFQNYFLKM